MKVRAVLAPTGHATRRAASRQGANLGHLGARTCSMSEFAILVSMAFGTAQVSNIVGGGSHFIAGLLSDNKVRDCAATF